MLVLEFLKMFELICNNCDVRNANSPAGLSDPQIKELLWLCAGGSLEQFLIFQWQIWSRDYGVPSAP